MNIQRLGQSPDGQPIDLFTLRNNHGLAAQFTNFGGTLVSLRVPDARGQVADVVLGFDEWEKYLGDHPAFGSLIGRYGNRIAHGRFALDGQTYALAQNNGPHHLHGGLIGFDHRLWQGKDRSTPDHDAVEMRYLSPDGEEGYPGNLEVRVTFRLTQQNDLRIEYHATTDAPTVVNLTHHGYFNLRGAGDIRDHELQLTCEQFTPVDEDGLPTGEVLPVAGTALDFRTAKRVGDALDSGDPHVKARQGFDHNFVLPDEDGRLQSFALLRDPHSGRSLELMTTHPGVQFYTANFLNGPVGKGGFEYQPYQALCLETQGFPDAPNRPHFPSTVLRPGEVYEHVTVHRFGW